MVNLYQRKIFRNGKHVKTSLYFDYYYKGSRVRKCIKGFYLLPGKRYLKENNRTLEDINILLIQENRKLEKSKNISDCIGKNKLIGLLAYLDIIRSEQKGYSLYDNLNKQLRIYLKHDIYLNDINHKWVEDFKQSLLRSVNLSVNSARSYYLRLKTLLNRAVRAGYIEVSPARNVEPIKKQSVKREFLTIEEIERIAALPTEKYKLIKRAFLFACFTGLRRRSVYNLQYSEIVDDKIQRFDEKTNSYLYLQLSDTAKMILTSEGNVLNSTGKVFEGLSYSTMTRDLKRFIAPLKLRKNVTFHTARHSYATLLVAGGVDLYAVSKLLGHADIQTTQIYAKMVDDVLYKAVKTLPVLKIAERN